MSMLEDQAVAGMSRLYSVAHRFLKYLLATSVAWGLACAAPEHRLTQATLAMVYGVQAFNDGDFARALEHFEQAGQLRLGDGEILYWRARAHLELGDLEEAVTLFEKSLRASNLERPAEEVQGLLRTAREGLEGGSPSPAVVADGTAIFLPDWSGLPRAKVRLSTDVGTDSNPGLLPDDPIFDLGGRGEPQAVGDVTLQAELYPLSHRRRDGPTLELSLEGARSVYADDSELDSSQARGVVQIAFGKYPLGYLAGPLGTIRVASGTTPRTFLVQLGTRYFERGGDSLHLTSQGAFSVIRAGKRSAFQLDAAFQDFDFDRELSRFDGGEARLRVGQTFYGFGPRKEPRSRSARLQYVRLSLGAGSRSGARDLDSSFQEGGLEASFRFGRRHYLYLAAVYRCTEFDSTDREDSSWRTAAAFVHTLSRALHLTASVSYGRRDSNDPVLDYERTTTSIGLAWYLQ